MYFFFFCFFFFQHYLRDTGIDFEFLCSLAHTQTFKKKKQGQMTSCWSEGSEGISLFVGNFRNQGWAIRSMECTTSRVELFANFTLFKLLWRKHRWCKSLRMKRSLFWLQVRKLNSRSSFVLYSILQKMISNHIVLSKVKRLLKWKKRGCRNNLSLIGRIYPRDELSVIDELSLWDG